MVVILPPGHTLLHCEPLTVEELAGEPVLTCERGTASRSFL